MPGAALTSSSDSFYPPGPAAVPPDLTKATPAYRRHAWIASGALVLFVAAYAALTAWFLWTAYWHLTHTAQLLIAGCSAFMAAFMLKALFFVAHRHKIELPEVTANTEPRLFAFLHRLADEAGAPRPHRVFISSSVNAAVFYDLSLINLLFPTRKNLEIGLGLVNVLSLDEFKAVCAHEFGHFAQRSMAVGRWVYTAQQVAAAIIARRDMLDRALSWLNRMDVRVAWVGWILSLIVWSVRSLLESAFMLVVLAHRALSREMEFQADLVAVSLTGSDALINGLHKLQAADDAWDRALSFAAHQAEGHKQKLRDLFVAQTRLMERIGLLLDDPEHGRRPAVPAATDPAAHRVFRPELAQPPRMWSTHPPNNEREENAKRTYLPSATDDRLAWTIFADPQALRDKITAGMINLEGDGVTVQEPEETIRRIDQQFDAEPLQPAYRGVYLARSPVQRAAAPSELYDSPLPAQVTVDQLDQLYPPSLAGITEQLRALDKEQGLLEALHSGALTAADGVIRHRGRQLRPTELPGAIESVKASIRSLESELTAHHRQCRTLHRVLAKRYGQGWEEYLESIAALLHYADHTETNLTDAFATLQHVVGVEAATGKVTAGGAAKILVELRDVYRALEQVDLQAGLVAFDASIAQLYGKPTLREDLPESLPAGPDDESFGEWVSAAGAWVAAYAGPIAQLKKAALARLLQVEAELAGHLRAGTTPAAAPPPCRVPHEYRVMTPDQLRPKTTQLSWWTRFQTAAGKPAAMARTATALSIVGTVLFMGSTVGNSSRIYIYNGLQREVVATVGGQEGQRIRPGQRAVVELTSAQHYDVATRTLDGELIENFTARAEPDKSRYFYSIASATPLVTWTAVYGEEVEPPPPFSMGAPRWAVLDADHAFEDPPSTVQLRGNRQAVRTVLQAREGAPDFLGRQVEKEDQRRNMVLAHARWDQDTSPEIVDWMNVATSAVPRELEGILQQRLAARPGEVVSLRARQDLALGQGKLAAVCKEDVARATDEPREPDLQYLAARCIDDAKARNRAFAEGSARWRQHPWFAYAHGIGLVEEDRWAEAESRFNVALRLAPMASEVAETVARLRAIQGLAPFGGADNLTSRSTTLNEVFQVLNAEPNADPSFRALRALHEGRLAEALELAAQTGFEANLVRLIAASQGPLPQGVAERAARMRPLEGVDENTLEITYALGLRQGLDVTPYLDFAGRQGGGPARGETIQRFFSLAQKRDFVAARALIQSWPLAYRARMYCAAAVLLDGNVPSDWIAVYRRGLFPFEKPYR